MSNVAACVSRGGQGGDNVMLPAGEDGASAVQGLKRGSREPEAGDVAALLKVAGTMTREEGLYRGKGEMW